VFLTVRARSPSATESRPTPKPRMSPVDAARKHDCTERHAWLIVEPLVFTAPLSAARAVTIRDFMRDRDRFGLRCFRWRLNR